MGLKFLSEEGVPCQFRGLTPCQALLLDNPLHGTIRGAQKEGLGQGAYRKSLASHAFLKSAGAVQAGRERFT